MHVGIVKLALSKARTPEEREALQRLLKAALALQDSEASFERRINASKAARGEGPTALTARKRAELESYAADAKDLEAQQLRDLAHFSTAASIIAVLKPGMEQDVKFWKRAHEKAHPGDAAVVREFCTVKRTLLEAITDFLSEAGTPS